MKSSTVFAYLMTLLLVSTVIFVAISNKKPGSGKFKKEISSNTSSGDKSLAGVDTLLKRYEKEDSIRKENAKESGKKEFALGEFSYNNLVLFIQKHGLNTESGEKQYTFFDSHHNRHALITIRQDHDPKKPVVQISVWAYYKGIRDQEHFFGYIITRDKVFSDGLEYDGTWKHFTEVRTGVYELVEKADKENLSGEEENH